MLLSEAIVLLKAGEAMHRTGWVPQDGYIVCMPGMLHAWKIVLHPTPNAGNYIFSIEDLVSSDWEMFEISKEPIEVAQEQSAVGC